MEPLLRNTIKVLLAGLLANSCAPGSAESEEQRYVAHLNLDTTRLLITEIADSLDVPRQIRWGPGGYLWYTEQRGTVGRIRLQDGKRELLWMAPDIYHRKSTGMFSLALHPDFEVHPELYVHYTFGTKDSNLVDRIYSRVVRLDFQGDTLKLGKIILDSIPGHTYHNGSAMLFGADGKLWLGLGDAGHTAETQLPGTLFGKVLRMNPDGSVPRDNPYSHSMVWSRGHRNIQGLASAGGAIYASEHGPNNDDEINKIEKARNYGWPEVHGFCDRENEKGFCRDSVIREPLYAWTPTIAPAGLAYYHHEAIPEWNNSLLLANLKGRALRVLKVTPDGSRIEKERIYLQKKLGRIRDVTVGPQGEVYLATSNLDWHPVHQPWMYDSLPREAGDRIIQISPLGRQGSDHWANQVTNPVLLTEEEPIALQSEDFDFSASEEEQSAGQALYNLHCASCHRPDGQGNEGFIPPLVNSEWVSGNTGRLIDVTLAGLNAPIVVNGIQYDGEMPGYRHLSDAEIRDILNFVRIEFGKVSGNIIAPDVMHQRKGLGDYRP